MKINEMSGTVSNESGEAPKDNTSTNEPPAENAADETLTNDKSGAQEVMHEIVYEPFEHSLAVFKNKKDERCGLSFRKSDKIYYFPEEADAYKMLKSILVHFGERKDSDDCIVPPFLHDVPVHEIDQLEEKGLIKTFEDSFGIHWSDIPSMRFKKHDYRRQLKKNTTDCRVSGQRKKKI